MAPGWLLRPWVDLVFVANLGWPLIAWFVATCSTTTAYQTFGFLLAYFVIMPHRWLTLPLVLLDRPRWNERRWAYLGVLAGIVALCSTIRLSMPTLALLVAIDYLWNAWHFAAQHAGIARMYSRLSKPQLAGNGTLEKIVLRTFFLYVLLRVTGQFVPEESFPWLEWAGSLMPTLASCDLPILLLPASLLVYEAAHICRAGVGRLVYLVSVCSAYAALLLGVHYNWTGVMLGCAVVVTWMHSTEYMAVVTWAVPKNRGLAQHALIARLIPQWTVGLLAFMAFFAVTTGVLQASYVNPRWLELWVWLNLNVSLLHYAYDGMIWKRSRKPAATSVNTGSQSPKVA